MLLRASNIRKFIIETFTYGLQIITGKEFDRPIPHSRRTASSSRLDKIYASGHSAGVHSAKEMENRIEEIENEGTVIGGIMRKMGMAIKASRRLI